MAIDITNPETGYDEELIKKEYDIIQSKIDKIGEFKFKIRGWSITVLSAALAGLISQKMNSYYWWMSLLIPVSFHFQEYQQEVLGTSLGKRAKALEHFFFLVQRNDGSRKSRILLKKAVENIESVPRVAVEMANAKSRPINWFKLLEIKQNIFLYMQIFSVIGLYLIGKHL